MTTTNEVKKPRRRLQIDTSKDTGPDRAPSPAPHAGAPVLPPPKVVTKMTLPPAIAAAEVVQLSPAAAINARILKFCKARGWAMRTNDKPGEWPCLLVDLQSMGLKTPVQIGAESWEEISRIIDNPAAIAGARTWAASNGAKRFETKPIHDPGVPSLGIPAKTHHIPVKAAPTAASLCAVNGVPMTAGNALEAIGALKGMPKGAMIEAAKKLDAATGLLTKPEPKAKVMAKIAAHPDDPKPEPVAKNKGAVVVASLDLELPFAFAGVPSIEAKQAAKGGTHEGRTMLCHVGIDEGGRVVGTDGHRLHLAVLPGALKPLFAGIGSGAMLNGADVEKVVDLINSRSLAIDSPVEVWRVGGPEQGFMVDLRKGAPLHVRVEVERDFPDWKRAMPKEEGVSVTVEAHALVALLERQAEERRAAKKGAKVAIEAARKALADAKLGRDAAVGGKLAATASKATKAKHSKAVAAAEKALAAAEAQGSGAKVCALTLDGGTFKVNGSTLGTVAISAQAGIRVGVNPEYLLDAVDCTLKHATLTLRDGFSPITITTDGRYVRQAVVMPLRLD